MSAAALLGSVVAAVPASVLPGAATPTPSPSPTQVSILGGNNGFAAWTVAFLLAFACIAIGLLMARQLRRMNRNFRQKVEAGELPDDVPRPGTQLPVASPKAPSTKRPRADGPGAAGTEGADGVPGTAGGSASDDRA